MTNVRDLSGLMGRVGTTRYQCPSIMEKITLPRKTAEQRKYRAVSKGAQEARPDSSECRPSKTKPVIPSREAVARKGFCSAARSWMTAMTKKSAARAESARKRRDRALPLNGPARRARGYGPEIIPSTNRIRLSAPQNLKKLRPAEGGTNRTHSRPPTAS